MTPDQLHLNAVAKTPTSVVKLAQAGSEIEGPLSKAFTNAKLTSDQNVSDLDLCARYCPVFALSMSEIGRCPNAEATFSLPLDSRPIDCPPCRANPQAETVIDKCVHGMLEWGIIEERPRPWSSPCTLVPKRSTVALVSVLIFFIPSTVCLQELAPFEARFLYGCRRRRQIYIYSRCPQRVLPTTRRRRAHHSSLRPAGVCFKRMPFGVFDAPMVVSTHDVCHLGPESSILTYMDDIICLDSTFEAHLKSLEQMFSAL